MSGDIFYQVVTKAQLLAEHEVKLIKQRDEMMRESKRKYDDVENFAKQFIALITPSSWLQIVRYNGAVYRVGKRGAAYQKHLADCKIHYQERKKLKEVV